MKVIIDRFEGGFAIAELPGGGTARLDKSLVPEAAEGDVVRIEIDPEQTRKREKTIKRLMDEVWND